MIDYILFWMAKFVAEMLLVVFIVGGIILVVKCLDWWSNR